MTLTPIANLKGPRGFTGKNGAQGLPGVNAVDNDEAVAGYISTAGASATKTALEKSVKSQVKDLPFLATNVNRLYGVNPGWKQAVDAVRAGTDDAKILCLGDSTTHGTGSSTASTVAQYQAYPAQLARAVIKHFGPAAYGLTIPPAGTPDDRFTLGSGWIRSTQTGLGFGGGRNAALFASAASGWATFADPTIYTTHFDVYYVVNTTSTAGTLQLMATGGTAVTVECGSQSAREIRKVTVAAGSAGTGNVLSMRNTHTTGSVYVVGIEPRNNGAKKIIIGNAGVSGSTSADWVKLPADNTDYLNWSSVGAIKAYEPDLTIIDLGINDAGDSVEAATFMANVQKLIDAATSVGSGVILKSMIPSNGDRWNYESEYADAMIATGLPVIDMFNHYGTWAESDAAGMMYDNLHGNDSMYIDEAEYIAAALMTVTPMT